MEARSQSNHKPSSRGWKSTISHHLGKGGKLRPFRLLLQDVKNLPRRYPSDWTTFNQLVFASAVYVFFTNLLPGITFASDLYVNTAQNWGTIEIVFSTGLCGTIFSLFAIQPLTILGVTGPFAVLAENIYELCTNTFKVPFLPFMAWTLIHAGWMHALLAIFNAHDWTMCYVTTFSTEIFSLLNSIIYFHKAVQELERAHANLDQAAFLYAIIGAVGTFLLALLLSTAESWRPLFHRYIRLGLTEYAAAISIIFFIGIPYAGELATLDKGTLPVSNTFRPTLPSRSQFLVPFWELPVEWVFAAIIPGLIITMLFFFDHEVSSIICTISRYNTRKPGGFSLDILLLGLTTALCGILGIPPANGLLPQAPLHSESLLHDSLEPCTVIAADGTEHPSTHEIRTVHEQRWSHLLHAVAILAFVSPPLQHVLGLTPTSVLAGLFLFMGQQSLAVNPILYRFFYLLTPVSDLPDLPKPLQPRDDLPLPSSSGSSPSTPNRLSTLLTRLSHSTHLLSTSWKGYAPIHLYTLVQILLTVGIFIMTLTVAGPAFPVVIIALVPVRLTWMRRFWDRELLRYVDGWACREGTPEGDEDRRNAGGVGMGDEEGGGGTGVEGEEADGRGGDGRREEVMDMGRGGGGEKDLGHEELRGSEGEGNSQREKKE
ncbi:HCO3 transporter family-domain-containing protein [Elsinoe ampelina]|uniref:HCO3 transporter family-domain-containing protein n=1 Tax=Elsinoe ampelina TaxID=302913 RepID=A0A6A6FZT6_9PEZI|nr:HCO3 transporter family-domain-containing protein [Elsinoe ampelina]